VVKKACCAVVMLDDADWLAGFEMETKRSGDLEKGGLICILEQSKRLRKGGEAVMMAMLASQLLGYRVATPGILV
jgi:hypothetical protein